MSWRYTTTELAGILGVPAPDTEAVFSGVSTDTRTLQKGQLFVALKGENFDGNDYVGEALKAGAAAAIANRPAQGPVIVVDDTLTALQCFAAEHRQRYSATIVALTGSNGKTSSKDFIASVLASKFTTIKTLGNLNNEIGCPLSLLQIDDHSEMAVIEMGANHPGEIASLCALARPAESAITNISAAHLEGFGSIEGVASAKAEIMEGLEPGGLFYANMDDPRCAAIAERHAGRVIRYGSKPGQNLEVELLRCDRSEDGGMTLDIDPIGPLTLPLIARAYASNVLLAVAIGLQHGIGDFQTPLQNAATETTRLKIVKLGTLTVIDDTYNANPASFHAALDTLAEYPGRAKLCAAGAMLELGEESAGLHAEVGSYAASSGVSFLFARGPHACDTIAAARSAGIERAEAIEDHAQMAEAIAAAAQPGDVVLVKGSRGMAMEKVVAALMARFAETAAPEG